MKPGSATAATIASASPRCCISESTAFAASALRARAAIDAGMRYIDTSRGYGESEWLIGRALKDGYRDKVLLSTKWAPWITKVQPSDKPSSDCVRRRIEESMKRLDVDYLDYYQVWNIDSREHYDQAVRKGGSVTLIGNASPSVDLPLQQVVTRQLTLYGSCAISGEYPLALDLMARRKVDARVLVSAVTPLSGGAVWFERLYRRERGLLKVVLEP
jgi:hypothetical protein